MELLADAVREIAALLSQNRYTTETQVSDGVILRLLSALGWNVHHPDQVIREYPIKTRRADVALLRPPFGAVVLIEVKAVGKASAAGEDQLFEYCLKQGVPLAILTDGRTWNFYLPAGMGSYEQRCFAMVDLLKDDVSHCSRILERYLGFNAVVSGQSHGHARGDYDAHRQNIVAREQFPFVLHSLAVDQRVVSLFSDEVEKRCEVRPDEREVRSFLRTQFGPPTAPAPSPALPRGPSRSKTADGIAEPRLMPVQRPQAPPRPEGKRVSPMGTESSSPSFTLFGTTVPCKNAKEVLVGVLRELGKRDPGLYERLAPKLRSRKRRHLAHNRGDVYPPNASQNVLHSVEKLPGGWWIGTNTPTPTKIEQLEKAREEAGISRDELSWQMRDAT